MEVSSDSVLHLLAGLRACSRHVERRVAEHPLDEIDVRLLAMTAGAGGRLRPSIAASELDIAFPSVTRHVRALRDAGYLSITPDEHDRRGYQIAITARGKSMLRDFWHELVTRFRPVLKGWRADNVAALADGLHRLASAMDEAMDDASAKAIAEPARSMTARSTTARRPRATWWRDEQRKGTEK